MWHIDTTVIRLLDGSRAYLHAVIDNFSRRILAWRIRCRSGPPTRITATRIVEIGRKNDCFKEFEDRRDLRQFLIETQPQDLWTSQDGAGERDDIGAGWPSQSTC
jgi:hypothetical protein